jgi:hypothetical protein
LRAGRPDGLLRTDLARLLFGILPIKFWFCCAERGEINHDGGRLAESLTDARHVLDDRNRFVLESLSQ